MKILVVTQLYYPENYVITNICEELVRSGHEVTVINGKTNFKYCSSVELIKYLLLIQSILLKSKNVGAFDTLYISKSLIISFIGIISLLLDGDQPSKAKKLSIASGIKPIS